MLTVTTFHASTKDDILDIGMVSQNNFHAYLILSIVSPDSNLELSALSVRPIYMCRNDLLSEEKMFFSL